MYIWGGTSRRGWRGRSFGVRMFEAPQIKISFFRVRAKDRNLDLFHIPYFLVYKSTLLRPNLKPKNCTLTNTSEKMDQQNHKACTRSSPQLMVENPGKWREGPQQITRFVQDGPSQLVVENPGKWQ